jgi:hypothetical protein
VGATPAKKNKIHPPQENGDCGRNLHTLCVPFFGDVRIKEYAFEKHLTHTHTHTLKKCQGLPALSVKWIVIKRRNVNTGWLVPPALHFPHQPLKNLTN